VTLRARWVTLRARWVMLRGSLGDAESSLGDAESSLGDVQAEARGGGGGDGGEAEDVYGDEAGLVMQAIRSRWVSDGDLVELEDSGSAAVGSVNPMLAPAADGAEDEDDEFHESSSHHAGYASSVASVEFADHDAELEELPTFRSTVSTDGAL
jgi:hypothetical protein